MLSCEAARNSGAAVWVGAVGGWAGACATARSRVAGAVGANVGLWAAQLVVPMSATTNATLKGMQVSQTATGSFQVQGGTASLTASATMTIKGALVSIN